jgi:hypothetical protein
MNWLLFLRPTRDEMPFKSTIEESRIVGKHLAYGVMTAGIRPLHLAVR